MKGDNTALLYSHGIIDAPTVTNPLGFGYYIHTDGMAITPVSLSFTFSSLENYGTLNGVTDIILVANKSATITLGSTGKTLNNPHHILNRFEIQDNMKVYVNNNDLTKSVTVQATTMILGINVSTIYSNILYRFVSVVSEGLSCCYISIFQATINGDTSGYGAGVGTGAGGYACTNGGSGGSHGGYGGAIIDSVGGSTPYGDTRTPITPGSGGGDSCSDNSNGAGGAAVHLISDTFQLDGSITTHG